MAKLLSVAVAVVVFIGFGAARAGEPSSHTMMTPDQIKWGEAPPVLPAGAKLAVMTGDPSKEGGIYVLRLKMPANYKIAAHTHPVEEHVTVLSGAFLMGMGDKLDATKTKAFPAGSFATMPANVAHYAVTKKETIIEIAGVGPFAMTYVNPADDPSKAAKK